jgi:mediator of RNA polymerase II transcription subunit 11
MAAQNSKDRLPQLETIEQQIASALQYAGQALIETSKDKPILRQVDTNTSQFMKMMENVETGLSEQINYLTTVSTGQPHGGSSYAAQKDMQMAYHRQEHVRSRIAELERLRVEQLQRGNTASSSSGIDTSSLMDSST